MPRLNIFGITTSFCDILTVRLLLDQYFTRQKKARYIPFVCCHYTFQYYFGYLWSRPEYHFWCVHSTLGFLAEISFKPLLYHPGGCLGCPEKWTSSRNYKLFVWSAVFQPKWNDIKKTYKNYQNPLKSYCFSGYFQSLFNFG